MSSRSLLKKRANRYRKMLRATPPRNIDLVDYLISRRYAQTRGAARKMLEEGKVRVDSHAVGRIKASVLVKGKVEEQWIATPVVSADLRDRLVITP